MRNRLLITGLACGALSLTAPAAAQQQPGPEAAVDVPPILGVVPADAAWTKVWEGPMIVDGMTAAEDGGLLFAQEQSNSIIKVWPDGKWWVQWPFVAGAGAGLRPGRGGVCRDAPRPGASGTRRRLAQRVA